MPQKKQFLRCLHFIFLKKEKERFSNVYDFKIYLPKYLEISYLKIWNFIQFQYYLNLKCHFLKKVYVMLAYLEQQQNYQLKSYYLECFDGFCCSCNAVEV